MARDTFDGSRKLLKRPQFLALRSQPRIRLASLSVQSRPRAEVGLSKTSTALVEDAGSATLIDRQAAHLPSRFGITLTKKIGSAVVRNRIRRRLREAIRAALANAPGGRDYVIYGEQAALDMPFERLCAELANALDRSAGLKENPHRTRKRDSQLRPDISKTDHGSR